MTIAGSILRLLYIISVPMNVCDRQRFVIWLLNVIDVVQKHARACPLDDLKSILDYCVFNTLWDSWGLWWEKLVRDHYRCTHESPCQVSSADTCKTFLYLCHSLFPFTSLAHPYHIRDLYVHVQLTQSE